MKIMKNKFFKIASLMIMLCLISTCAIGTTFAKYVTNDAAYDSARVAKWGVQLEMVSDKLFNNEYQSHDANYAGLTVKSDNGNKLVAPGTSGKTAFSISGTPEVATRITISMTNVSDVVLPAGSVAGQDAAYYPVVFTLKQTNGATDVVLVTGTLADIQAFLTAYSGAEYAPNTDLHAEFELSWEWAYSVNDFTDKMDTLLGDIMAGEADVENSSINVAYNLSVTVTQID